MTRNKTCLFAMALTLCVSPCLAGTLETDPAAYIDGSNPQWHGSTDYQAFDEFDQPTELYGHVDWAVYAPGTFPSSALAGYVGWSDTGATTSYSINASHFIYAYQIFEEGTDPLSFFSVFLANPAYNIGWFTSTTVSGDSPTGMVLENVFDPFGSSSWSFDGVGAGESTTGVIFSAPTVPMNFAAVTVDGGNGAFVIPVPSPDSQEIPEPATLTLAAFGLLGLAVLSARRRLSRRG